MPLPLLGAVLSLVVWITFTFFVPLGPGGTAIHLLLGVAGVLFVRWWALRTPAP
ncbi:MAG: hypothetical protein ABI587_00825 [Gemmatimonadales bacterium]